jgi:adenylate cyclase
MTKNRHPALGRLEFWLGEDVWNEPEPARIVERLIELLCDSGIPLLRANVAQATLHPELVGFAHIWKRGSNRVEPLAGSRADVLAPSVYDRSPFRLVAEQRVSGIRRRLERVDCADDFDLLTELRTDGATDYVVMTTGIDTHSGSFTSWATDRQGGFTTPELVAIAEHVRLFGNLLGAHNARATARNLVNTYVGRRAGRRILAGDIVRGRGVSLDAAIWLSDIRDFTGVSERLPSDELLALLNSHFDTLIKPVHAQGGEVLKLMGDAILAVFPAEHDDRAEAACMAALTAAREARAATDTAEAAGEAVLRYAIALHYGTVTYGNVGASNRLDFTVIGPAVNLASRLNSLGKNLGREIILSAAFADHCTASTHSLGTHGLRGIAGRHEVFAPGATSA